MSKRKFHIFVSTPFFAIIGRVGSMLIPFIIAYFYGAGRTTDALLLAFGIIISIAGLFAPMFESMLVPYLAEQKKESKEKVSSLSNGVMLCAIPGILLVFLGVWISLSPLLARYSGLGPESAKLTGKLFLEMFPLLFFWILSSGCNSIFYTNKNFWFPAVSPIIRTGAVLFSIFAWRRSLGIHSITVGFAIGEILRWMIGAWLLRKSKQWGIQVHWDQTKVKVREFYRQAAYQLLALLGINLIPLTDQWFASWLGTGNLSLISYADRLFQIPNQLMLTGFLQIFLSYWAESYYAESPQIFWKKSRKDIRIVFWISVIGSLVMFLIRKPLVQLVFGFGKNMQPLQLDAIASLFGWLMVGFAPTVLNLLYVRVLFVLKKSAVFCVQSWIRFILNFIFNYIFMKLWGLKGIAISTSCVYIATSIWLHYYLKKYDQTLGVKT